MSELFLQAKFDKPTAKILNDKEVECSFTLKVALTREEYEDELRDLFELAGRKVKVHIEPYEIQTKMDFTEPPTSEAPAVEPQSPTVCLYRQLEGGGMEGRSFDRADHKAIQKAANEGWSTSMDDFAQVTAEQTDDKEPDTMDLSADGIDEDEWPQIGSRVMTPAGPGSVEEIMEFPDGNRYEVELEGKGGNADYVLDDLSRPDDAPGVEESEESTQDAVLPS